MEAINHGTKKTAFTPVGAFRRHHRVPAYKGIRATERDEAEAV